MMVFHRRSKRVKIFSKTFVTKYLYKRDSNTSKRTCILIDLIHNYLKEKTRKKKESEVFLVNIGCLRLKFNVYIPFDGCFKLIKHTNVLV